MYEAPAEKFHVAKTQPNTDLKWHQPDRQKVRVDVNLNRYLENRAIIHVDCWLQIKTQNKNSSAIIIIQCPNF